jgi:prepilin-type N-terminal cleavage/methylation domain-containing protein
VKTKNRCADRSEGFTLIELLTVIFIIGLLAAILIPAVSIAMRKAKIGAAEADLRNLALALGDYQIDNGSLPPIHACPVRNETSPDPGASNYDRLYWAPYVVRLAMIGEEKRTEFNDRFSESEDLNANNALEPLAEDIPWYNVPPEERVTGRGFWVAPNEVIDRGPVPYQYFPINADNMRRFRTLLRDRADDLAEAAYSIEELRDAGLRIPAPYYDRFVIFSLGPDQTDHDILPRNATSRDDLRLRTYYRSTLDLNNNDAFDFNYRDRIKRTEPIALPDVGRPYKRGDAGVIIVVGP